MSESAVGGEGSATTEATESQFREAAIQALQSVIAQGITQPSTEAAQITTITTPVAQGNETMTTPVVTETPRPAKRKAVQKLTVADILTMTPEAIGKLTPEEVADIEPQDLMRQHASQPQKVAFRGVKNKYRLDEEREKVAAKEKKAKDWKRSFKDAQRRGITSIANSCYNHYNGADKGDPEFTVFVNKNYDRSVRNLIEAMLADENIVTNCTLAASRDGRDICEFRVDLDAYFGNRSLAGMSVRGGVTDEGLSVFHAGPLGVRK